MTLQRTAVCQDFQEPSKQDRSLAFGSKGASHLIHQFTAITSGWWFQRWLLFSISETH
jgi:preprotein translocase subunit SecG